MCELKTLLYKQTKNVCKKYPNGNNVTSIMFLSLEIFLPFLVTAVHINKIYSPKVPKTLCKAFQIEFIYRCDYDLCYNI